MGESVRSSAGLVWRHQRLLWWIFAVNLTLAWLGSLSMRATLSEVLNHSLESARLVTGFDVSTLVLLLERPEVQVRPLATGALEAAAIFLLFMLAIDGGVISVYLQDRKLSREEFFGNCGRYLWRMVRLALYSIVPFGVVMAGGGALANHAGEFFRDAPQDWLGFFVKLAGKLLTLLVALLVRLWFDLAQARVVRGDERRILRELGRSFKPAFRSGLYGQYLAIGLITTASIAVGAWVWVMLPHAAMGASFAVLELATIAQIGSRLWMKAASARWVAMQATEAAVSATPMEAAPAPVIAETELDQPQAE